MPKNSKKGRRPPATSRIADGFSGQRLLVVPMEWLDRGLSLPVVRDLQVTHIGHFNAARNHFVERQHGCRQAVLIYCMAGSGFCELAGKTWTIREGTLLLIPPDQAHSYYADSTNPWSIFWVHFTGVRAADHRDALELTVDLPLLEVPRQTIMRDAFEETIRHAIDGFSDHSLLGLTTGLSRLIGLARIHSLTNGSTARRTKDRLLALIHQLHADPARDWTIEEMAGITGLSLAHFSARFHQQTGGPPKQFLIRLRLQIASALMQDSSLTVAQIAHKVGYEDPYYFSRLFRIHNGQSPRAHRRDLGINIR